MALIGLTRYAPNPAVVFEATEATGIPHTIDATTLKVTFTLPVTSNILARLQGWHDTITTHASQIWGLTESGTFVPGSGGVVDRTVQSVIGVDNPYIGDTGKFTSMDIYLPNIAAGSHTYCWAWGDGENMRLFAGDGSTQDGAGHIWAPALMQVYRV